MSILANYDIEERRKKKMKSDHRIIVLRLMEGKKTIDSGGRPDPRLFTGENKLHAQFSHQTGMWKLHYDFGAIPGGLQNLFTTFPETLDHVKTYFSKRNIEVIDVVDAD